MKLSLKSALALVLLLAAAGGILIIGRKRVENPANASPHSSKPIGSLPERPVKAPGPGRWTAVLDDSQPLESRLNLVRGINLQLAPAHRDYLLAALDRTPATGRESDWWLVMNEIMEQLRKSGGGDQYTARMIELIQNPKNNQVTRDYAIQHLAQWIAPVAGTISPSESDSARREQALRVIADTIRDPALAQSTIPGTALLALVDLSSRLPGDSAVPIWNRLNLFFKNVISGETEVGLALRVSAIQAVAIRGDEDHLPAIRSLATSEATEPSVRLSSIASLGFYGSSQDIEFLEALSVSDTRYQYAAKSALKRFRSQ